VNVEALRQRNTDTRLFTPADRQEALKFAPGAQFVGRYATTVTDKPLAEIDFRDGRLSAKLPMAPSWVVLTNTDVATRYRAEVPSCLLCSSPEEGLRPRTILFGHWS
jgi:hypothetical protein